MFETKKRNFFLLYRSQNCSKNMRYFNAFTVYYSCSQVFSSISFLECVKTSVLRMKKVVPVKFVRVSPKNFTRFCYFQTRQKSFHFNFQGDQRTFKVGKSNVIRTF